jgi:transposase
MKRPDHNTINRFRSEKLKGILKEVFAQVVTMMVEQGLVDIKTIYVDGTKVEANANKYTFVWGKSIKRYKDGIKAQLEGLWK